MIMITVHLNHLMRYKMEWHNRCLQQKYDQMLREVSALMEKQQARFSEAFEEQQSALKNQIQLLCKKIHETNPNFNFEDFYKNPAQYIEQSLCSDQLSMGKSTDSCMSSITKAEQSVAVLEQRLERLKEENEELTSQIQQGRQEQRLLLNTALQSEANAQQKNCDLKDCKYNLENRFENIIGGSYNGSQGGSYYSRPTSRCDPKCYP